MSNTTTVSPDVFATLDAADRDDVLTIAYATARRASELLARLYVTDAALRTRETFPEAASLVFSTSHDGSGIYATIAAVNDAEGNVLWTDGEDDDDPDDAPEYPEWDDETLVRDRLAAAAKWDDDEYDDDDVVVLFSELLPDTAA